MRLGRNAKKRNALAPPHIKAATCFVRTHCDNVSYLTTYCNAATITGGDGTGTCRKNVLIVETFHPLVEANFTFWQDDHEDIDLLTKLLTIVSSTLAALLFRCKHAEPAPSHT